MRVSKEEYNKLVRSTVSSTTLTYLGDNSEVNIPLFKFLSKYFTGQFQLQHSLDDCTITTKNLNIICILQKFVDSIRLCPVDRAAQKCPPVAILKRLFLIYKETILIKHTSRPMPQDIVDGLNHIVSRISDVIGICVEMNHSNFDIKHSDGIYRYKYHILAYFYNDVDCKKNQMCKKVLKIVLATLMGVNLSARQNQYFISSSQMMKQIEKANLLIDALSYELDTTTV